MEAVTQPGARVNEPTCPLCNAPMEPGPDRKYCARCEQLLSGAAPAQSLRPAPQPKWYHNIWVLLLMLFFVLGPLGLPLVWKNPTLARWVKVALTLAMIVYTMLLIEGTLKMVSAVMNEMQQINSAF